MAKRLTRRLACALLATGAALFGQMGSAGAERPGGAHAFEFTAISGDHLPLSAFAGKAVLVVNTASLCGYTHQYGALQTLFETYGPRGFVVVGAPSNDFGGQEPGAEADIRKFCETNFNVRFPLTEKIVVAGPDAHPFYRWAAETLGEDSAPRWNFHKYLIGPDGALLGAFPSAVEPMSAPLRAAVEAALPREGA